MASIDELKNHLESCRLASNRTRASLVVLTTASILIFASLWNSYDQSWTNLRIARIGTALGLRAWNVSERDSLHSDDLKRQFDMSRQYMTVRGISDSSQLAELLRTYRAFQINEIVNVRAPFIGIHIDVNDLGLASGVAFTALLLWLRFSLTRELLNMKVTVEQAKKLRVLPECYHLLAMHQLFNIPKTEIKMRKKWETRVPRFLLFIPLFVQTAVFANDIYSLTYAMSISPINTTVVIILTAVALCVMFLQLSSCRGLISEINRVWD